MGPGERQDSRTALLRGVRFLNIAFSVVEVVSGVLTGSLALIADAGEIFSDWSSKRPVTPNWSFGFRRVEVLVTFINGEILAGLAVYVVYEAYRRLDDPPEILGGWMLAVATGGIIINIFSLVVLARFGSRGLSTLGSIYHTVADTLGSIATLGASGIIVLTGWRYADLIISVPLALFVLASAVGLLNASVRVLLEGSPLHIDPVDVGRRMVSLKGVVEVHDLHILSITPSFPTLSAHVLVANGEDISERLREIEKVISQEFGIEHTTLQIEHVGER